MVPQAVDDLQSALSVPDRRRFAQQGAQIERLVHERGHEDVASGQDPVDVVDVPLPDRQPGPAEIMQPLQEFRLVAAGIERFHLVPGSHQAACCSVCNPHDVRDHLALGTVHGA